MAEIPVIPEGYAPPPPIPEGYTQKVPSIPEGYSSIEQPDFWASVLPGFIQEGWNRSITGITGEIITGEKRFDLSGYELSTLEDIGATVASFLMPADFLLTVGTGGLASIPARALAKRTAAQLVKHGIKGQVAKKVAQAGVTRAVQGASVLGVYSGAQSAAGQQAEFGEIDPGEVTKATLRGTITGAIAGGAGGALAGKGLPKVVEIGGEVAAFGTAAPALEARIPTGQDYLHAAGVIIGLRAVHATASKGMKTLRQSVANEIKVEVEKGTPIKEATEAVGTNRLTEVQAQRAIEAPDVPVEAAKPGIRPEPREMDVVAPKRPGRRFDYETIPLSIIEEHMPAVHQIYLSGVNVGKDYPGLFSGYRIGLRGRSPVGAKKIVREERDKPVDYDLMQPTPEFIRKVGGNALEEYGMDFDRVVREAEGELANWQQFLKPEPERMLIEENAALEEGLRAITSERNELRRKIGETTDANQREKFFEAIDEAAAEHAELSDALVSLQAKRAVEVQSVRAVFTKQEADIRALGKFDYKKAYAELKRRVVDVRANVRQKLLKEGGDEGRKVVVKFDVVAGAPSWAKLEYFRAEKEIFTLSPPEETMLGRVIQAKRSIELDRIYDKRGEPRLDHTGGKGKESLEAWVAEERAMAPGMMKRIESSADLYFKEMQGQLDQLYSAGLLNKESYDALLEYQHYSPRRFLQHLDPDKASFDASGRPISIPDSGLKKLDRGSEQSMMNNPRLLLMQTMARTQGRIFRNEANKSLHRYIQENPDNGWVSIQEPKRFTEAGVPEYGKAAAGKTAISVVIEGRQNRMVMDNEFAKEWLIRDPEISTQLSNTVRILSGGFILRPLATGINPEFAVANLPRDMAHILLTTQEYSSTLPVGVSQLLKDIAVVAKDATTKKGRYIDYMREGGGMEFLTHQGRIAKEGAQPLQKGFLRGLRNTLEYVGETSEILTRLALRERAIINGKSPQEATWIARNYLDFSQGGSFTKAADAGIPYLSAAVQGTRGIIRAAHDNPGVFTYKVAQIGMLSVGLYLANREKNPEAWAQVPDRQKVSNWIITTPYYNIDQNGKKRYKYITIAKDQGQRVFASMFEALMERSVEGKMPRKQVLAAIADFLPLIPTQMLPPTLESIMGYAMNKDFWYREDIWKGPKVEAKEEYRAGTHPFFVKFGDVTGLSPVRMRYALGNIFTRRNIYTDMAGAGWDAITGGFNDEQRSASLRELKNVPFARRLFKETNPLHEDVEDLERLSIEEGTRRHKQNRELSEIYSLNESEKENLRFAANAQVRKRIYRRQMSERNTEFREFIQQQPQVDRKRLINRRNAMQRHIGLSNWWYDLMELSPESRATAFYSKWYELDAENRNELLKTARRIGGIMSGRFMAMFRRLAKGELQ